MPNMDDLVTVFASSDASVIMLYRTMLQEAGVSVVEVGAMDRGVIGLTVATLPRWPVRLAVRRGEVEKARALIAQYTQAVQAGLLRLPDEDASPETEQAVDRARAFRRGRALFVQVLFLCVLLFVLGLAFWPQH